MALSACELEIIESDDEDTDFLPGVPTREARSAGPGELDRQSMDVGPTPTPLPTLAPGQRRTREELGATGSTDPSIQRSEDVLVIPGSGQQQPSPGGQSPTPSGSSSSPSAQPTPTAITDFTHSQLPRTRMGHRQDQSDACTSYQVIGGASFVSTCSYDYGGSGYYVVENVGSSPARMCWRVDFRSSDVSTFQGCHNLDPGEIHWAACAGCGTNNGGARSIELISYQRR